MGVENNGKTAVFTYGTKSIEKSIEFPQEVEAKIKKVVADGKVEEGNPVTITVNKTELERIVNDFVNKIIVEAEEELGYEQ